jgi:hypothetical protein
MLQTQVRSILNFAKRMPWYRSPRPTESKCSPFFAIVTWSLRSTWALSLIPVMSMSAWPKKAITRYGGVSLPYSTVVWNIPSSPVNGGEVCS